MYNIKEVRECKKSQMVKCKHCNQTMCITAEDLMETPRGTLQYECAWCTKKNELKLLEIDLELVNQMKEVLPKETTQKRFWWRKRKSRS